MYKLVHVRAYTFHTQLHFKPFVTHGKHILSWLVIVLFLMKQDNVRANTESVQCLTEQLNKHAHR